MAPPPAQFNVLRVVLGALQSRALQAAQPGLYEQCLELVYALAAAPDTGGWWWSVCAGGLLARLGSLFHSVGGGLCLSALQALP